MSRQIQSPHLSPRHESSSSGYSTAEHQFLSTELINLSSCASVETNLTSTLDNFDTFDSRWNYMLPDMTHTSYTGSRTTTASPPLEAMTPQHTLNNSLGPNTFIDEGSDISYHSSTMLNDATTLRDHSISYNDGPSLESLFHSSTYLLGSPSFPANDLIHEPSLPIRTLTWPYPNYMRGSSDEEMSPKCAARRRLPRGSSSTNGRARVARHSSSPYSHTDTGAAPKATLPLHAISRRSSSSPVIGEDSGEGWRSRSIYTACQYCRKHKIGCGGPSVEVGDGVTCIQCFKKDQKCQYVASKRGLHLIGGKHLQKKRAIQQLAVEQ